MAHFMTDKKQIYYRLTQIFGIAFSVTYFLRDYLFEKIWLSYLLPAFAIGITFLDFFILLVIQEKKGILFGLRNPFFNFHR